jgi:hypothetical protein
VSDWPDINPQPHRTAISAGDIEHSIGGPLASAGYIPIITQAWGTANDAVYIPFRITNWMTITRATWENGATVAGNVSVAIYNAEFKQVKDSAGNAAQVNAAMAGASAQQVLAFAASVVLPPGLYYLGFSSNSATATLGVYTAVSAAGILRAMGVFFQATAYPLPDPATPVAMTKLVIPSVAIVTNPVG